jgi:multiple sugar transport system substrate-binding protein
MRHGGVQYGIPVAVEPQVLFYRTDLLAQKGLKVPQTMDELYETAKKLKSDEVAGMALRLIRGQGSWWPWSGFMVDYGATWVDQQGVAHLDEPAAIAATTMYTKINKDAGPAGVMNYGWYEVLNSFAQGKTAMILDANSFMQQFEDPQKSTIVGKVGVAPIPGVNGSRACAGGPSWGVAMASQSKNKDAAWRFLKWATSPAVALNIAINSGDIARDSIWSNSQLTKKYPFPDWIKASRDSNLKYSASYNFPRVPQFAQLVDIVDLTLQEAYKGDQPVADIMKQAQQKTTDALASK